MPIPGSIEHSGKMAVAVRLPEVFWRVPLRIMRLAVLLFAYILGIQKAFYRAVSDLMINLGKELLGRNLRVFVDSVQDYAFVSFSELFWSSRARF